MRMCNWPKVQSGFPWQSGGLNLGLLGPRPKPQALQCSSGAATTSPAKSSSSGQIPSVIEVKRNFALIPDREAEISTPLESENYKMLILKC